ncbi:MAG: hypothetical protein K0U98_02975 [Deltaproteobacteria bacterium]|nr:hypothetical protein [Deltaproteobacteria bacterium]
MKKVLMVVVVSAVALLTGFPVMASDAAPAIETEQKVETSETVDLSFLVVEPSAWLGLGKINGRYACEMGGPLFCGFGQQCPQGYSCFGYCCVPWCDGWPCASLGTDPTE